MQVQRGDIMGMSISIDIADAHASHEDCDAAFAFLIEVDNRFSTYKTDSEISRLNRGEVAEVSEQVSLILRLAEETRKATNGYFNIARPDGALDPSGIVKGWAILEVARLLCTRGVYNFFLNVGGDIQPNGVDVGGQEWTVGIRNPFNRSEIIKVIYPRGRGVVTSGTAERGAHIYNPHNPEEKLDGTVSITVIGPDVYEADRFATAAFAMGQQGIAFIESLPGFEGYAVNTAGIATMTSGFYAYTQPTL